MLAASPVVSHLFAVLYTVPCLPCQEELKPVLAIEGSLRDTAEELDPVDQAKLQAGVAAVLNSAYFMFLRVRGHKATSHPVAKGMSRVGQYWKKIETKTSKRKEPAEPTKRVDAKVVKRNVEHSIGRRRQQKGKKR